MKLSLICDKWIIYSKCIKIVGNKVLWSVDKSLSSPNSIRSPHANCLNQQFTNHQWNFPRTSRLTRHPLFCCRPGILVRAGTYHFKETSPVRNRPSSAREERHPVRRRRHGRRHLVRLQDIAGTASGQTGRGPRTGLGQFSGRRSRQGQRFVFLKTVRF